jgi:hypothetical protein
METRNYTFDADTLSDLHKDAYGFRPRSEEFWAAWDAADNDGKQRIWDNLLDDLDRALEIERECQQEAIADFEDRIRFMISTVVGCTREDAIRYLHDVYDTNGNVESLEFELGVPFGYISKKNWG